MPKRTVSVSVTRSSDRAAVLPLVTRWELPESGVERLPEYDLALIGTWSWKPNRIGLDWFLSKVVPHLPADMSIGIAGQLPDAPAISHPGLRFLGRVPDARAFVEAGAVVPLISRGGTGVQLKTIETFELGMPSVATRASLRGIGEIPGNCAVADDPVEFARLADREGCAGPGRQSPAPVGRGLPSGAENQVARNAQAGPCRSRQCPSPHPGSAFLQRADSAAADE